MLETVNGKEREAQDWYDLLGSVDPRFRIVGIKKPLQSRMSFIEVMWHDEIA